MAKPETGATPATTPSFRLPARWRRLVSARSALPIAAGLSLLWAFCVAAYAIGFFGLFGAVLFSPRPVAALEIALFLLAAVAPSALFFYGAVLVRKAEEIRHAAARLTSAVDALRLSTNNRVGSVPEDLAEALVRAARAATADDRADLAQMVARVDAALGETQALVDELTQRDSKARREAKTVEATAAAPDAAQPALPFAGGDGAPEKSTEIKWDSVVRALQFPKDAKDQAGFDAIRDVVGDHDFAALLQAAEDVLSLLAEDGLYMEDIEPKIAPLPIWRRYGEGARGKAVSEIGGVRDEVALAIARGRVRNDPVFRDTALHFLRRFDRLAERMVRELGDDQMVLEVADSRTGRAFMIVGRVMGAFD